MEFHKKRLNRFPVYRNCPEKAGKTNENPDQPEKKNPNHPDTVSEFEKFDEFILK